MRLRRAKRFSGGPRHLDVYANRAPWAARRNLHGAGRNGHHQRLLPDVTATDDAAASDACSNLLASSSSYKDCATECIQTEVLDPAKDLGFAHLSWRRGRERELRRLSGGTSFVAAHRAWVRGLAGRPTARPKLRTPLPRPASRASKRRRCSSPRPRRVPRLWRRSRSTSAPSARRRCSMGVLTRVEGHRSSVRGRAAARNAGMLPM